MNDLISVVVPIYNVQKYLSTCLESIINQTYKNLEIILINDGSTDESIHICEKFKDIDDRIILISQSNHGLSHARNTGINASTGNYITFVDSDDFIDSNYIMDLYHVLIENDVDMAWAPFVPFFENEIPCDNSSRTGNVYTYQGIDCFKELFSDTPEYIIVSWGKLFKKELFSDLRYPVGKLHEDEFIIHHILNNCEKIAFLDRGLYFYLQRVNSIMNSSFNIHKLDRLEALVDRYEMLKDTKFSNKMIERILEDCIYNYKNLYKMNKNDYSNLSKIRKLFKYYYKKNIFRMNKNNLRYLLFRYCPLLYITISN